MEFLSATTFGACLGGAPEVDLGYEYRMNVYHQHFLTWGFHKSLYQSSQPVSAFIVIITIGLAWSVFNFIF